MPSINFSHRKLRFSLAAGFVFLFVVASFSYATSYQGFVFLPASLGNAAATNAKPTSVRSAFASFFSFSRSAGDEDLAPAAVFTVNSNNDSDDQTPGNGVCADATGNCTLRAAIQEANASAGVDEINFNFINPASSIQLNPSLSSGTLTISEAITITGPGARFLTVNGNSGTNADVFNITAAATGTTKINGLTISNAGRYGINNAGKLELTNASISGNRTGINNINRLMISRVLISNNAGGGVVLTNASNNVNISNTTITGNGSPTLDNGGGINSASADVTLNNVTISHNTANNGGGLYYSGQTSGINVRNTIIAKNTAQSSPDVSGVGFNSRGNNLIGVNVGLNGFSSGNGDKLGTILSPLDPKFGPLQNNGGQTDSRALLTGSPAKDAGNACVLGPTCSPNPPAFALTMDQRGTDFPRTYESAVDIGAFETYYPTATVSSFAPGNWGTGRGAFDLVINGENFVADSIAKWNGQDRATTFISNNQLKVRILDTDVAVAGQKPITVVNPTPNPGQADAVNFTVANCTYTLSAPGVTVSATAGSDKFTLTTQGGCTWTAASNANWLAIDSNSSSGTGTKVINFSFLANLGAQRTGTITIAGQTFTVTQNTGCSYSVPTTSAQVGSAASSNNSFALTTGSGCQWTATTTDSWITINSGSQSGTGSASISYSVQANIGPQRTGKITVNGQDFTIVQASGCDYTISPNNKRMASAAGSDSFSVSAGAGCQWTATKTEPWITLNNSSGSGNGNISFTVAANTGAERTGTITVNGKTVTITQDSGCSFTLSPSTLPNISAAGLNAQNITVTANNSACTWTASVVGNPTWLTITSGASGTGNGTVVLKIAANTGPQRSAIVNIGDKTLTVTQDSGCVYSISTPNITNFSAAGGNGSFVLNTGAGCTWTATSNNSTWLTVAPASASGTSTGAPITINFSVNSNSGIQRTGTISVNGQTFSLTQLNGCSFQLSPAPPQTGFPAAGGSNFNFTLTASDQACTWSASTTNSWVTIPQASQSGNGTATINFTLGANPGVARPGVITVTTQTGNITYSFNQANGCVYTLSNPPAQPVSAAGTTSTSFTLTATDAGCPWTATTTDSWITINAGSQSGNGSATISFSVAANTGPERSGTISVGGKTYNVSQASGCVYNLSSYSTSFQSAGGTGNFDIRVSNPACGWTAVASQTWIKINSNASGTGDATINFTVDANVSPLRSGTITIGGRTFSITQSDGCTFNLSSSETSISATGGNGSVIMNSGAGCTWTASASPTDTWIKITSGSSGSGNGTIAFTVDENVGPLRTGTIATTGGRTFKIIQSNGCRFNLSTASLNNVSAAGETISIGVTATNQGCSWTTSNNNFSWITVTGGVNGNGTATVTIAANPGLQRNAQITIANQTVNVTQLNGCSYSLTPSSFNFDDAGGATTFSVTASDQACPWTAQTTFSWISITSGTGPGNGQVSLSVQANSTGDDRIGTISVGVAGNLKTFTVNQLSLSVSNKNDSGIGSLRQAIINANLSPSDDVITFKPGSYGTINLTSGEIKIANNGKLEIRGPGADVVKINAGDNSRIFFIDQATVTIKGVSLSGGNGVGELNTSARNGGAVYVYLGNTLFSGVNISNNNVANQDSTGLGGGGGIYYHFGNLLTMHRIENCSITGNTANFGAGILYTDERDRGKGLTIVNSTISGNIASSNGKPGSGEGGGIYSTGNLFLRNTTIGYNSATGSNTTGAGLYIYGEADSANSLIAKNNGHEITISQQGSFTSLGNNLIGDSVGDSSNVGGNIRYQSTDILDTDPKLCDLALLGGPTPVLGLMPGSVAIDKGNNNASLMLTDQRGSTRVINGKVDIGAFEYNIGLEPTESILPNGSVGVGYSQQLKATRVNAGPIAEQFKYELVEGPLLSSGLTISDRGFIGGTPTTTGTYNFMVRAVGTDEMAGVNKYSITIGCSPTIGETNKTFAAAGGDWTIPVNAPDGCGWRASTNSSWITINSGIGNGNGTVTYTVQANTGAQRTATINVSGQVYTVTQSAPIVNCTYSLTKTSVDVPAKGGTGNFDVTSTAGCNWTAVSSATWVTLGGSANVSGTGSGTVAYSVSSNPGIARTATIGVNGQIFTIKQAAAPRKFDFDGDGKSDIAVFRSSNASWYMQNSTSGFTGMQFGIATDKIAPADYDGDGKTDVAVFRDGYWFRTNSSDNSFVAVQWGIKDDVPVPADYDGDGKADLAVFRAGYWYIYQSSNNGFRAEQFGIATDKPVPADFDGDGKTDVAVFRDGNWYWLQSSNNSFLGVQFGMLGDKAVVGNYDSDNKADQAVFRDGYWYLNLSTTGFTAMQFGKTGDIPVPADYDGDGKTDIAVFRDGNWYWNSSINSDFKQFPFGFGTDKPVESAYVP